MVAHQTKIADDFEEFVDLFEAQYPLLFEVVDDALKSDAFRRGFELQRIEGLDIAVVALLIPLHRDVLFTGKKMLQRTDMREKIKFAEELG
jgi:hypothetical protein